MIEEIKSTILQILIFTLIPLIVYLIRKRTFKGFGAYIGFKKTNRKAVIGSFLVAISLFIPMLLMVIYIDEFKNILHHPNSASGKAHILGASVSTYTIIVIKAVFRTALSEEILFRGFITKRLIAITNYQTGNLIQAFIFGIIHSLFFLTVTSNPLFLIAIFVFPFVGAYVKVYFNEKVSGGSILPGWVAHATANLLSYFIIGLVV